MKAGIKPKMSRMFEIPTARKDTADDVVDPLVVPLLVPWGMVTLEA